MGGTRSVVSGNQGGYLATDPLTPMAASQGIDFSSAARTPQSQALLQKNQGFAS